MKKGIVAPLSSLLLLLTMGIPPLQAQESFPNNCSTLLLQSAKSTTQKQCNVDPSALTVSPSVNILDTKLKQYILQQIESETKTVEAQKKSLKTDADYQKYFYSQQLRMAVAAAAFESSIEDDSFKKDFDAKEEAKLKNLKPSIDREASLFTQTRSKDSDITAQTALVSIQGKYTREERLKDTRVDQLESARVDQLEKAKYQLLGQNTLLYQDRSPTSFHKVLLTQAIKADPDFKAQFEQAKLQLKKAAEEGSLTPELISENLFVKKDGSPSAIAQKTATIVPKMINGGLVPFTANQAIDKRLAELKKTAQLVSKESPKNLGLHQYHDLILNMIESSTDKREKAHLERAFCEISSEVPAVKIPAAQIAGMVLLVGGVGINLVPAPGFSQAASVMLFSGSAALFASSLANTFEKKQLFDTNRGLFYAGMLSPESFKEAKSEFNKAKIWAGVDLAMIGFDVGGIVKIIRARHQAHKLVQQAIAAEKAAQRAQEIRLFKNTRLNELEKASEKLATSNYKTQVHIEKAQYITTKRLAQLAKRSKPVSTVTRSPFMPKKQDKIVLQRIFLKYFDDPESIKLIEMIGDDMHSHVGMALRSKLPTVLHSRQLSPLEQLELRLALNTFEKDLPEVSMRVLQSIHQNPVAFSYAVHTDEVADIAKLVKSDQANHLLDLVEKRLPILDNGLASHIDNIDKFNEFEKTMQALK